MPYTKEERRILSKAYTMRKKGFKTTVEAFYAPYQRIKPNRHGNHPISYIRYFQLIIAN